MHSNKKILILVFYHLLIMGYPPSLLGILKPGSIDARIEEVYRSSARSPELCLLPAAAAAALGDAVQIFQ